MREYLRPGAVVDSTRGCTIFFPVNIVQSHCHGIVAHSDTSVLRVWESLQLDDVYRAARLHYVHSVILVWLRFVEEDFWNIQVFPLFPLSLYVMLLSPLFLSASQFQLNSPAKSLLHHSVIPVQDFLSLCL